MSAMENIPNTTYYKTAKTNPSKYRLLQLPINNFNSGTLTIPSTGTQLLEFLLPAMTPYNLSKSFLAYDECLSASTAGSYNWHFEDVFDIASTIYFGQGGGNNICNLEQAQNWSAIGRRLFTKQDEYATFTSLDGLYPCNMLASNNVSVNGGTTNVVTLQTGTGGNYIEPQYMTVGGNTATLDCYRQFPLGAIKKTIFSLDKNLWFPTPMYARFTCGPCTKIGFQGTSNSNPVTGGTTALNGSVTLNNVWLYLAIEQNQTVRDSIEAKVNSAEGLKILVPYTMAFRNTSSGTVANYNIQFTDQYGGILQDVITTVFNPTETNNTAYDCDNTNGNKITYYQTKLDQKILQDFNLVCGQAYGSGANSVIGNDDYRENKQFLVDSVYQNLNTYQFKWFHMDSFRSSPKDLNQGIPEENYIDGLVISNQNRQWSITAKTNNYTNGLVWYNYMIFQRELTIHNNSYTVI